MHNSTIGSTFGKDNQYTIIGTNDSFTQNNKLFKVHCSNCAKDPELFGDAMYDVPSATIRTGKVSCGCSLHPRWSARQYIVRITRECNLHDYEFVGFDENYSGSRSRIILKCKNHNHIWKTRLTSFLNDQKGCTLCGKHKISMANTIPDEILIEKFMATGSFREGTIFKRSETKYHWDYWCPVCANDEYSLNGLCTGWFTSHHSRVLSGGLSCRCLVGNFMWSKEQYEYKIKKELINEPQYTFICWNECVDDATTNSKEKCTIHCSIHDHYFYSSWFSIKNGARGGCCSATGFDSNKPAHLYVIKTDKFVGFGISNNVHTRMYEHYSNFNKNNIIAEDVKLFYFENGLLAFDIETNIKREFHIIPQNIPGFKTEAISLDDYELLLSYLTY